MKAISIDHIVLCVQDVQQTIVFYREVLGMKPREERPGKWSLHFGSNKISLQAAATAPELATATIPGSGNFCVLVDDAIETVQALLDERQVDVLAGPVERDGATGTLTSFYFRDPDGNLVEVGCREANR